MEINNNIQLYWSDICQISYEGYKKELSLFHDIMPLKSFEEFTRFLNESKEGIKGLVYLEEGKCTAFLLYNVWEDHGEIYCSVPEWGYGSVSQDREKVICRLFQALASDVVTDRTVNFSVHLYAHEMEIQRLFSYMEFGIQAETGICRLGDTNLNSEGIRELKKEEIIGRWKEIWCLLEQLIQHLQKSPIFYLGEEFTEEVYREFFTDSGTRVFVAEEKDEIIGLIESNTDNIPLLFSEKQAVNVGEVYVLPQYRGKNVAQTLLNYAKQELFRDNYQYAWVEHGTANPNARYFWNRYFATYKYEMIRRISSKKL